jgi:hypothetical protein
MTIFHKSMLAGAVEIARIEKENPLYRSVLLQRDGTVIAANEQTRYVAQGSQEAMYKALPFGNKASLVTDVAVTHEQLSNLIKMVPADKQFNGALEHVDISTDEGNVLDVTYNDGRGQVHFKIRSGRIAPALANYKGALNTLGIGRVGQKEMLFNRACLESAFSAMKAACKYDGKFEYIMQRAFSKGYMWRTVNGITSQSILIFFVMPEVKDIELGYWEKKLFTIESKISKTLYKGKEPF